MINIIKFAFLKARTGTSFALIQAVCWIFQVKLLANYQKELNMINLELVPLSILRQRDNYMKEMADSPGDVIPPQITADQVDKAVEVLNSENLSTQNE